MTAIVETILSGLTQALRPLVYAVAEEPAGSGVVRLALEVGYDLDGRLTEQQATDFAGNVTALYEDLAAIAGDPSGFLPRLPQALSQFAGLYQELSTLDDLAPVDIGLGARLFDYLVTGHLRRQGPDLYALARFFGIVTETPVPASGKVPAFVLREIRWDRVPRLTDPAGLFADVYGWGSNHLDSDNLLSRLTDVLWMIGLPAYYVGDGAMELIWVLHPGPTRLALRAEQATRDHDRLPGIALFPEGSASLTQKADLGDGWQLSLSVEAGASSGYRLTIRPGVAAELESPTGQALSWHLAAELAVSKAATPAVPAVVLFGSPDASRFEVQTVGLRVFADTEAQGLNLGVEFSIAGGRLVVTLDGADGFLRGVLPGGGLTADIEFAIGWSTMDGLTFRGGAGLELTIPLNRKAGPITVESAFLSLAAAPATSSGTGGGLTLTGAVTAALRIGPIAAIVDRIGTLATFTTAPPFGFAAGFLPPAGIGIGLDDEVVSGSGYLSTDAAAGTYQGVLDLELLSFGISAVAIIDTKPPDVQGWSLFFALFLDLPSLQLGFGFTLLGVGGVAGINRAVDIDALESTVRSGSLDPILFPTNPVADASTIISELRSIFPPADGSYVFGPIVKIGWGTPTLIEASLGVVIQLPDPVVVAVLGSVNAILPEQDLDLVSLNIDVAGVIDTGTAMVSVDGSLHDSHVAQYAISGDMALRLGYGDEQTFLLSVGGFHPRFKPPGDFPDLRRLSLGISSGALLRVDFQCYLAITSNSVQFGADFVLDAEVSGFGIHGSSGFDALVKFKPFAVRTSVHFKVTVTAVGVDLIGVTLRASIDGPNCWHVIGTATFEVLGLEKDIRVDVLIGSTRAEPAVEAPDLLTELVRALKAEDAWRVVGTGDHEVTFVDAAATDGGLAATPDSVIEVRQTLVPLGLELEQFGNAPVGAYSTFDLSGTGGQDAEELEDWFAPAEFLILSASDQLEGPSFELMRSGLRLGAAAPVAGPAVTVDAGYRSLIIDPELPDSTVESRYTAVLAGRAGVSAIPRTAGGFTVEQPVTVATAPVSYSVVDSGGSTILHTATWAAAWSAGRHDSDLHVEVGS